MIFFFFFYLIFFLPRNYVLCIVKSSSAVRPLAPSSFFRMVTSEPSGGTDLGKPWNQGLRGNAVKNTSGFVISNSN